MMAGAQAAILGHEKALGRKAAHHRAARREEPVAGTVARPAHANPGLPASGLRGVREKYFRPV